MYYTFIDTNIFIRTMSQGTPGCEIELFERLCNLVEKSDVLLLVPEVIQLELKGYMTSLEEQIKQSIGDFKKNINSYQCWSEIRDAKTLLVNQLDLIREEKIRRSQEVYDKILKLLDSKNVYSIPFTPYIMTRAKARIIRRAMPRISEKSDQDAAIMESLIFYFSTVEDLEPRLLFCSENYADFAFEVKSEGKSQNKSLVLHPVLAEGLPKTYYLRNLSDLLQVEQGYEVLPPPPEDEEIRRAMEELDKLDAETDFGDDGDLDKYLQAQRNLEELNNLRLISIYNAKIVPNLLENIRCDRQAIVKTIQELLEKCRECSSWDERSEMKLNSWMEHIPEDMVSYTSMLNLLKITANLRQYLSIHKEMSS